MYTVCMYYICTIETHSLPLSLSFFLFIQRPRLVRKQANKLKRFLPCLSFFFTFLLSYVRRCTAYTDSDR